MNIAHLHWGFPPVIGGVETHLTIILPELVKNGNNVSLLTGSFEKKKVRDRFKGADIHRSPLFDLNWLAKRGLESLEEPLTTLYDAFFDSAKPDIIHAHNMHYFSRVHSRLLKKYANKMGIPLILTAHNVWDDIQFLSLTRDTGWDHIIAVSHYIKKEIMGIGYPEYNITTIHHGVDVDVYKPGLPVDRVLKKYPELKNRRVIFHPARMGLAKGCDVAIKAMNLVRERIPEALLVLAGSKNIIDWGSSQERDIAYMVDLVNIFKLKEHVYINSYALEEMPELYNAAEVCIYPSSSQEPFGLTMLEAMASSKPMIVTNVGGMPEIIRNDIDGYVIKLKDYEALALNIIRLLAEDGNKERIGRTARQTVRTHYTKEIMAKSHIDLYNELIKSKGSVKKAIKKSKGND
ncbi:MAG: glycosyltransferase family 4 protein [Elusimicrobiota bacterium]